MFIQKYERTLGEAYGKQMRTYISFVYLTLFQCFTIENNSDFELNVSNLVLYVVYLPYTVSRLH